MSRICLLIVIIVLQGVSVQFAYAEMAAFDISAEQSIQPCHSDKNYSDEDPDNIHCKTDSLCCVNLLTPQSLPFLIEVVALDKNYQADCLEQKISKTHFDLLRPPQA